MLHQEGAATVSRGVSPTIHFSSPRRPICEEESKPTRRRRLCNGDLSQKRGAVGQSIGWLLRSCCSPKESRKPDVPTRAVCAPGPYARGPREGVCSSRAAVIGRRREGRR